MNRTTATPLDVESSVHDRYSEGAQQRVEALCCPIDYDPKYLKLLPAEVLERDYGCGDPSRYVRHGDVVLDLGSGGGKICFIASQIVGPTGRVIGVDMNLDMLDLARRNAPIVAERVGWSNVEFHRGRIQDLQLPLDTVDARLAAHPVRSADDLSRHAAWETELRRTLPDFSEMGGHIDRIVTPPPPATLQARPAPPHLRGADTDSDTDADTTDAAGVRSITIRNREFTAFLIERSTTFANRSFTNDLTPKPTRGQFDWAGGAWIRRRRSRKTARPSLARSAAPSFACPGRRQVVQLLPASVDS